MIVFTKCSISNEGPVNILNDRQSRNFSITPVYSVSYFDTDTALCDCSMDIPREQNTWRDIIICWEG